jgi:catechol 2,3-dioxygenase-like lactoylglutathione lyase family enzyme
MSTMLAGVTVATADPERLARFWAEGLGWQVLHVTAGAATVTRSRDEPPWGDGGAPRLVFTRTSEPHEGRNRIHLDVASTSSGEQHETAERLLALGATRIDIGQRGVPWEVLADPDGNELCVLEPRRASSGRQGIAAVVIRCRRPRAVVRFWSAVTGCDPDHLSDAFVSFSGQDTADLELLASSGELGGSRLGVGVQLPEGSDRDVEVARLERAGGRTLRHLDGTGGGPGVGRAALLADREGARVLVADDDHLPDRPDDRERGEGTVS